MTRRRAALRSTALALALAGPLVLTACGGGGGTTSGESAAEVTSITVLDYYNDASKQLWQDALETCGTASGVTIDRTTVPGGDLVTRVLQQSQSKTLPDLLMLDNPDVQQIASSGALAPLDQFGVSTDGFSEGVVQASTYDGQLYGLQPITNTIALFYNKTVLDAAGVEPPTTWDELKTAAAALTEGDRYGMAFSATNTFEGTWQFLPFMWSNGGDEKDIATPETAEALQLWVDLFQAGSVSPSVVSWEQADVNDQFKAGNAAMMVNGPWQFDSLDATEGLDYGIVPIPAPTAGATVVSPLGGETWTVPETGDPARQAKAAEVLQCLNSDENQLAIASETNTVPTKTAVADELAVQDPAIAAFAEQVPDLRSRTGELGEEWPDAATKIYTAVQSALVGGQTPTEALEQAQNG